jgi:hypothetical protein
VKSAFCKLLEGPHLGDFFLKKKYSQATLVLKRLSALKINWYEKDIVRYSGLLTVLFISKLPEG